MYKTNSNDEIGMKILKNCPYQEKLYRFLIFFSNEKNILTWMRDAWSLHFESEYVENQLINPLIRY